MPGTLVPLLAVALCFQAVPMPDAASGKVAATTPAAVRAAESAAAATRDSLSRGDLLVLAIYNLVENALKFTCATDSVEIRLLEDGRAILIEVADSGGGIPAEDVSKIFEELYRGSNARSTEGSGLGLALVNRIIALHGGRIDVRSSQEEPRGTVFTIRLPVTKKSFILRPSN